MYLNCESLAEIERLFPMFAEGGKVQMALDSVIVLGGLARHPQTLNRHWNHDGHEGQRRQDLG